MSKTLPPLPEWSKMDNLGGLVPSEIRQGLRNYALAAIEAQGVPDGWLDALDNFEKKERSPFQAYLASGLVNELRTSMLASAPPAPQAKQCEWTNCPTRVGDKCCNEQASVAQQEPVAWKHDCAALLTNDVELWIDACPHCGKPRIQPAQQEPVAWLTEPTALAHIGLKRDVTFHRPPEKPDWTVRPLVYGDTNPAQQAKPQPLSSDRDARITELERELAEVRKDAERWNMVVEVGQDVLRNPNNRKIPLSVSSYMNAIHKGFDLTGAIDTAIDAAMKGTQ